MTVRCKAAFLVRQHLLGCLVNVLSGQLHALQIPGEVVHQVVRPATAQDSKIPGAWCWRMLEALFQCHTTRDDGKVMKVIGSVAAVAAGYSLPAKSWLRTFSEFYSASASRHSLQQVLWLPFDPFGICGFARSGEAFISHGWDGPFVAFVEAVVEALFEVSLNPSAFSGNLVCQVFSSWQKPPNLWISFLAPWEREAEELSDGSGVRLVAGQALSVHVLVPLRFRREPPEAPWALALRRAKIAPWPNSKRFH